MNIDKQNILSSISSLKLRPHWKKNKLKVRKQQAEELTLSIYGKLSVSPEIKWVFTDVTHATQLIQLDVMSLSHAIRFHGNLCPEGVRTRMDDTLTSFIYIYKSSLFSILFLASISALRVVVAAMLNWTGFRNVSYVTSCKVYVHFFLRKTCSEMQRIFCCFLNFI